MADQYPNSAGYKEGTTSRDAAQAIEDSGKAPNMRRLVLAFFDLGFTGTPDEVAAAFNESPLSIRPRITELYQLGKIERTGERRKSSVGRPSHVYRSKVSA